jgi:hypothetical protein
MPLNPTPFKVTNNIVDDPNAYLTQFKVFINLFLDGLLEE